MSTEASRQPDLTEFEIKQYEVHLATYRVAARSVADAIYRTLQGDAEYVDGSLEYVNLLEDGGMSVMDDPALADELRELGVGLEMETVPSIHSVQQLSGATGA